MSFDFIAPVYDPLVRLVFGNRLYEAQWHFLSRIENNSEVLVVGGGTGVILSKIDELVEGCRIFYVEPSISMMRQAQSREMSNNTVEFINCPILEASLSTKIDFVVTPFVLDLFSSDEIERTILYIKQYLFSESRWLNIDFVNGDIAQNLLIKTMYLFFYIFSGVRRSKLINADTKFRENGFIHEDIIQFDRPQVLSVLYQIK